VGERFLRNRVNIRPRSGWAPGEASSAQPFTIWLHEFQGESGIQCDNEPWSGIPQCGPYEALEGIYSGRGQEKLGVGELNVLVDNLHSFFLI